MRIPFLRKVALPDWVVNVAAGVVAIAILVGTVGYASSNHQQNTEILGGQVVQERTALQNKELEERNLALTKEVHQLTVEHSQTLAEIASLQQTVSQVIAGLPPSVTYLGALIGGFEKQIQSVCNSTHATCSDLPVPLPSAIPRPAPTTTTTTQPQRHGHLRLRG